MMMKIIPIISVLELQLQLQLILEFTCLNLKIILKLKFENICKKAIFLSPKVYCLLMESEELIYKVKGLKHEVELTYEDFELLLVKDSLLQKSQRKFRKFLNKSHIEIWLLVIKTVRT